METLAIGIVFAGAILLWSAFSKTKEIGYCRNERLTQSFIVDDFLVSRDFPIAIKKYCLTETQFKNLRRLCVKLEPFVAKFGRPQILSGGRPKVVGDFVSALRARGYSPADPSAHDEFAAVDLTWGDPEKNLAAYAMTAFNPFRQAILYKTPAPSYLHLAIYEPLRPEIPFIRSIREKH